MKMKFIICILLLTFCCCYVTAQVARTSALAGITLPIKDVDNSFNPYDMAGNYSFLYLDETTSWLKINPSLNSTWGDYRRVLDADRTDLVGLNFTGLKTLGTDGTFIGKVTYYYDARTDVNRSLKYNTYRGEAFFINDSSSGDIRYSGPAVTFGYSFEVIPNLYLGAGVGYKIFKGLKQIYSQSSTTLRNVDGSAGLTYKITDNMFIAGSVSLYNSQESITAALSNPVDVEIYNYHGESYRIMERSSSISEKIKEKGYSWGSQFYVKPDEKSEAGINFVYSNSNQSLVFPKTVGGSLSAEYEDGYSYFNNYSVELKGRYDLFSDLTAGIRGFYANNNSWSKLSALNMLVWDWKLKNIGAGVGASYKVIPNLSLSLQYDFANVTGDSSKYIDNHYASVTSNDHIVRIAGEYEAFSGIILRGGYALGKIQNDLIYGGSDIKYDLFSFGAGINLFSSFIIDILFEYNNYKPKQLDFSRNKLNGLISVKLFNI